MKNPYENLFIYLLDGEFHYFQREDDPSFLGSWIEGEHTFLFFAHPEFERLADELKSCGGPQIINQFSMAYSEWQGGEEVEPLRSGQLRIVPFWKQIDADPKFRTILIDPGVVFGSGTHPTTKTCLEALNIVFSKACPRTVVDLGTGTGILALASAALGAGHVLAVDLNPLCVRTTLKNVKMNNFAHLIDIRKEDIDSYETISADVVIANIHMAVMERILKKPKFFENPWIILSGLLRSEARRVEDIVKPTEAAIVKKWESEDIWSTYLIHGKNR